MRASAAGCRDARDRLQHLAALGGAVGAVLGFGEALSLAGILSLAGVARALARALSLAGVGAAAMDGSRMGGGDEGRGGKDRRSGDEEGALVHGHLSWLTGHLRPYQVIRGKWAVRYGAQRIF